MSRRMIYRTFTYMTILSLVSVSNLSGQAIQEFKVESKNFQESLVFDLSSDYDVNLVSFTKTADGSFKVRFPGTRFTPQWLKLIKPACVVEWNFLNEEGALPETTLDFRINPSCNADLIRYRGRVEIQLSRITHGGGVTPEGTQSIRIEPGDLLSIEYPGRPELNYQARVERDGTIVLPIVGSTMAQGRTLEELESEISKRLEGYVYPPEVNVSIREFHYIHISVKGGVKRPGQYTLPASSSLKAVLEKAGGRVSRAKSTVIVKRIGVNGEQVQMSIDLNEVDSFTVQDKDEIHVPLRQFIYVGGLGSRPRTLAWTPEITLGHALAQAGFKPASKPVTIQILRQTADRVITLTYELHGSGDPDLDIPLHPEDIVQVVQN